MALPLVAYALQVRAVALRMAAYALQVRATALLPVVYAQQVRAAVAVVLLDILVGLITLAFLEDDGVPGMVRPAPLSRPLVLTVWGVR